MKIRSLWRKVSLWWNGEWYKNDPEDAIYYIGRVFHPTAIFARKVVRYLQKEHKFIIGTLLTLLGLALTIGAF